MTRSEIGPRVKEVLARHLAGPITDKTVVGGRFIEDEDLQLDLMFSVRVPMFVNSPTATVAQLIEDTEEQWDEMADWERKSLAAV